MSEEELNFFDAIAPVWDADEVRSTPSRIKEILDMTGIKSGEYILDLGTGTGVLIPYLLNMVGDKGKVIAVDASLGMLNEARRKFGSLTDYEIFEHKDFEKEDIAGKFDKIFLYCVYPHLTQPLDTLKKLCDNNLKPGGKIFVAFPSDEHFINGIHKEKKVESELLPPAKELSRRFSNGGLKSKVLVSDADKYVVMIEK